MWLGALASLYEGVAAEFLGAVAGVICFNENGVCDLEVKDMCSGGDSGGRGDNLGTGGDAAGDGGNDHISGGGSGGEDISNSSGDIVVMTVVIMVVVEAVVVRTAVATAVPVVMMMMVLIVAVHTSLQPYGAVATWRRSTTRPGAAGSICSRRVEVQWI